jgi:hypothetical protein
MTNKRNAMKTTVKPPRPPKAQEGLANTVTTAVTKALKALPKGTFAAAGGALAGPKGMAFGRMISALTGVGDYEVGGPTSTYGGEVPHFTNHPDRTIIKHREFVTNVKSAGTDFTNTTYDINPGNKTLFPWLSGVARNYQQYKILGMVAIYKPLTSDYAAGGGMGQVVLATNYNVNDLPYESVRQMENSEYAVAVKPSKGALHPIECAAALRRNDPFYVYDPDADSGATSDKRFYDMGKLQVATEGLSTLADVTIGQLWVTYEIELLKPILPVSTIPASVTGYAPGYWTAADYRGAFTTHIANPGVNVFGTSAGSVAAVNITLSNQLVGKDILVMYYLQQDNLGGTVVNTANFDAAPTVPPTTAQHEQKALDRPGLASSVCGHLIGRVIDASNSASITIETTLGSGTSFYGGWVFVYTPYNA